ncbi:MAG: hypothetical protein IJO73_02060 [Clostridia bacterium]|nr:hypothetical protein [Clostridia bacterium]
MKKITILLLSLFFVFSFMTVDVSAFDEDFAPYVINFSLTPDFDVYSTEGNETRASGLISSYGLNLTKSGSTLTISGRTTGTVEVVRSGFKDLMVQRRKTSDDSWKDYYEYGNLYVDGFAAFLETNLEVAPNYQYRITCKHYAKKSLLVVQTISNVSNIVTTV